MDLKYYKRYYCKDIENVENFDKAKADNFVINVQMVLFPED